MLLNSVNIKQIIDKACEPIYMRRENIERITKAVYTAIQEDRKEIAKEILKEIQGYQSMSDERGKRYNLYELSQTDLENIFDRYGIEVSND